MVHVDVGAIRRELTVPSPGDREAWLKARRLMLSATGESTFDIWLAPLELIAVDSKGLLVLTAPVVALSWVQKRFGLLISRCCEHSGCRMRFASPQERLAIENRPEPATGADPRKQPVMNRRAS